MFCLSLFTNPQYWTNIQSYIYIYHFTTHCCPFKTTLWFSLIRREDTSQHSTSHGLFRVGWSSCVNFLMVLGKCYYSGYYKALCIWHHLQQPKKKLHRPQCGVLLLVRLWEPDVNSTEMHPGKCRLQIQFTRESRLVLIGRPILQVCIWNTRRGQWCNKEPIAHFQKTA